MNHALDFGMFWAGALFAFTPIVVAGVVLGVWWYSRKRRRPESDPAPSRNPWTA